MPTSISSDFRAASAHWLDLLLESIRFSTDVDIAAVETVETKPRTAIAPAETASLAFCQDREYALKLLRKAAVGGDIKDRSDMFEVFECRTLDGTLVARLGLMNRTRPLSLHQNSMGSYFADMFGSVFEAHMASKRLTDAMSYERTARHTRRSLHQFYASSISSKSREEAAQLLATGASELFENHLCLVALDCGENLEVVFGDGFREEIAEDWRVIPKDAALPIPQCVRDGSFIEIRSREQIKTQYPDMLEVADMAQTWNVFCFPIIGSRGVIHGALAATPTDTQLFDDIDRALLLELLDYTASALDQIDALNESRQIGLELQLALLPRNLPAIDWLDLAALYKPALETVGGDWYDVIDVSDDSVAVVIGDVAGHNTRSAAIMGQVRHVVASKLARGLPPHQALIEADFYFSQIYKEMLVTVCAVVITKGCDTVLVSSAGHPPPLIYDANAPKSARLLTVKPGPPIGFGKHEYFSSEITWGSGSVLALTTDGVFERQGLTVEESLGWLINELEQSRPPTIFTATTTETDDVHTDITSSLEDDTLVAFGSETSRSLEPLLESFLVAANNSHITDDVAVILAQRSD